MRLPCFDSARLCERLALAEDNLRALEVFSSYLNLCPRYAGVEDVRSLSHETGVSLETAYALLVSTACGLNVDGDSADRSFFQRYIRPAVRCLDAGACRLDPYYATVRMPSLALEGWRLGYKRLEAGEAFVADDLRVCPDGREIAQIGFFMEPFEAPAAYENGREWMTVTPSEINTMSAHMRMARGRVAVFGLGLGYYPFMAAQRPQVSAITIVERSASAIRLFKEQLLPQFPHREKISIVQDDAFAFVQNRLSGYDMAYVDLWHDVLDGVEMYLRMKRLEARWPRTRFLYWIEPSMLAWLRGMGWQELRQGEAGPVLEALGEISSWEDLMAGLSDEGLRAAAARISLEVTRRDESRGYASSARGNE